MREKLFRALLAFTFVVITVQGALACACCLDRGFYQNSVLRPDSYYMGLLGEMKMAGDAELYMSEAGFEAIIGLGSLERQSTDGSLPELSIVEKFSDRRWRLELTTAKGSKGTLLLPMPATGRKYMVDQHDTPKGEEISVYKELSFQGRVSSGSGLFKSAAPGTPYTLVFQGRGNGCDNASDFRHWRLELNGRSAKYAFFGSMKAD